MVYSSMLFKNVVETDKLKKVSKGELMANDQDAMEVSWLMYWSSNLGKGQKILYDSQCWVMWL